MDTLPHYPTTLVIDVKDTFRLLFKAYQHDKPYYSTTHAIDPDPALAYTVDECVERCVDTLIGPTESLEHLAYLTEVSIANSEPYSIVPEAAQRLGKLLNQEVIRLGIYTPEGVFPYYYSRATEDQGALIFHYYVPHAQPTWPECRR